jgi:hypothetical protein
MSFMSNKEIITDRSAWKTDDPEWVKTRKRQWRDIRRSLEYNAPIPFGEPFYYVKKKQHKRLKEFFLTGTITTNYPKVHLDPKPNHPLRGIEAVLLFYIWLHPDSSVENWVQLREKLSGGLWYSAQDRFYESIFHYPVEHSLFGDYDFEKRLYDFFCARQGTYAPSTEKLKGVLTDWIYAYFQREHHTVDGMYEPVTGSRKIVSYPNHIVRHGLNDYVDCCWELLSDEDYVAGLRSVRKPGWEGDNALEIFFIHFINNIASCYFALEVAEENDPIYAEVAQTLLDLMQAKSWPPIAQHVFKAGKAKALEELQAKP